MTPAVLAARRIGEILVEKGFITAEQLEEVLADQEREGQRIGDLLIDRGLVSRLALAGALAEQWATLEGENAAVGARSALSDSEEVETLQAIEQEWQALRATRPIGEIFVERGMVTQEELGRALEEQKRTGQRLGEVLVAHGAVTRLELASVLAEQWEERPRLRLVSDPPQAPAPVEQPELKAVPPPVEPAAVEVAPVEAPRIEAKHQEPAASAERDEQPLDDLRASLARLTERVETEGGRLEEIARDHAREAAEALLAERETALEESAVALELRLHALEAFVADVRVGDPAASDLAADLEELRASLQALPRREEVAAAGAAKELAERIVELEAKLTELGEKSLTLEEIAVGRARSAAEELVHEHDRAVEEAAGLKDRVTELERFVAERDASARVEALAADVHALAQQLGEVRDSAEADRFDEALTALAAKLEDRIVELEERPAAAPVADPRVERLDDELDQVRSTVAALVERLEADDAGTNVEALTAELAELRHAQEQLADRQPSVTVEAARIEETLAPIVASLTGRIDALEHRLADTAALEERLGEELGARFESRAQTLEDRLLDHVPDPAGAVGEVAALATRLAALEELARSTDVGDRVEELEQRLSLVGEVGERLAELEQRPTGDGRFDELEQRVSTLGDVGERLAELEQRQTDDARVDELEQRLSSVGELGERLAQLEQRATDDERFDELERRVSLLTEADDSVAAALRAELETRLAGLQERAPGDDRVAGLEQRVSELPEVEKRLAAELRSELEAGLSAASAEAAGRLAELDGRLAASGENAERLAKDLRSELDDRFAATGAAVDERVVEIEERLSSLDGVEQRVGATLRKQLDELRVDRAQVVAESAALATRLGRLEERSSDGEATERVAELEQRLSALGGVEERLTAELHGRLEASLAELAQLATQRDARVDELDRRLAEVAGAGERARADLTGQVEEQVATLRERMSEAEANAARAADALEQRVDTLGGRQQATESELEAVEARVRERIAADLRAELAALAERVATSETALTRAAHDLDERLAQLDALHQVVHGELGERLSETEASIWETTHELDGRLLELRREQHDANRALEGTLAGRLGGAEARIRAVEESEERVRGELRDRLDRRTEKLDAKLEAATSSLEGRVGGLTASLGARLEALEGELGSVDQKIRGDVRSALERLNARLDERADALRADQEQGLLDAQSGIEALFTQLGDRQQLVERELDATVGQLASTLEERMNEVEGKIPRLGDAEERIRAELRGALERQSGRIGKRLVENEELVGAVAEKLVERLEALETRIDEADAPNQQLSELAATVDALSERVDGQVASALAALAGFPTPPPAVEPVAQAETATAPERELEPPVEPEGLAEPVTCFLAFVPTSTAYKLIELEGALPAVGTEVEIEGAPEPLVVARVVPSPIPLDRRPCVYLEERPMVGREPDADSATS